MTTTHKIGVLCLEVPPDRFPGSLSDPSIFPVPTLYERVEGAWVDAILASDPALVNPTVRAAKRLEQRGATFLISNCGFFINYRSVLLKQVSVPAAISSLLWLPHLNQMRPAGGKIGIATYDATKTHYGTSTGGMAGPRSRCDRDWRAGTRTWRDAGLKDSIYDFDQIWEDLRVLLDRLVGEHPAVQLILMECATLCASVPLMRRHLGMPTYGIVALANCWLDGLDAGTFSNHVRQDA